MSKKHKRDGDDDGGKGKGKARSDPLPDLDDSGMRCPFYVKDPRGCTVGSCATNWNNISYLKDHLFRTHFPYLNCPANNCPYYAGDRYKIIRHQESVHKRKPEEPVKRVVDPKFDRKVEALEAKGLSWKDLYNICFDKEDEESKELNSHLPTPDPEQPTTQNPPLPTPDLEPPQQPTSQNSPLPTPDSALQQPATQNSPFPATNSQLQQQMMAQYHLPLQFVNRYHGWLLSREVPLSDAIKIHIDRNFEVFRNSSSEQIMSHYSREGDGTEERNRTLDDIDQFFNKLWVSADTALHSRPPR